KGVFGDCQFTCFPDCQLALPPESAKNLFFGGQRYPVKGQRAAPLTFVAICRSEIAARASPTINQSSE
ncbi:hypothetical protein, partial [Stutzerimonas stutzeri]|uniref:hypothetical protein n=1 Tax=Stutzerimonas stutzeri TaxID=316 RepID=UPI001C0C2F1D